MVGGDSRLISLVDVREGEAVQVVEILGGHGLVARLEALGIRPGAEVKKISSVFLRGPITVEVHDTKVAMGYGMARKVLVKPAGHGAAEGGGAGREDGSAQEGGLAREGGPAHEDRGWRGACGKARGTLRTGGDGA